MKKILYITALLFSFMANAQIVNFLDDSLKNRLLEANSSNQIASTETPVFNASTGKWTVTNYHSIDINGDGEIQTSEASLIKYINIYDDGDYFGNYNDLVNFINVEFIEIFDTVDGFDNDINYFNCTGLINLKVLILRGLLNLTTLNLSGCTSLIELINVGNPISSIDFSGLSNLERLTISACPNFNLNVSNLSNLKYLDCWNNNQFTNLNLSTLSNLEELKCNNNNQLTSLNISGLTNLHTLHCNNNQLPSLDVSGLTNLNTLNCSNNQLTSLNVSGLTNLQTLNCYSNQLTSLNVSGLTNLNTLYCYNNQLSSLNVSGLMNLQNLYCSNNQLSSLNVSGLMNLQNLYCSSNQLPSLDVSSLIYLKYLGCSSNQLPSLNVSSSTNLQWLGCSNNQLSSLNALGLTNLSALDCSNNQLSILSVSGLTNLNELYCSNNNLTTLDINNNPSLSKLDCSNNLLTSLYFKKGLTGCCIWDIYFGASFTIIYPLFSNNPYLEYICADNDAFYTIQSKINEYGYTSTCHVNSYCSFTPGGTFYTINGNNRFDVNSDGCDVSDANYPNLKFNITNGLILGSLISNEVGDYSIPVQAGIHTITPQIENPTYFNVSPASVTIDFPTQASPFTQDFCITPNGVHNDVEVTLFPIGVARPGFDATYKIVYKNKGNTIQSGTVLFNFDDCHQVTDFVSATPNPDVVSFNELAFNYTNLLPFEIREITLTLNVNSPMETPAVNIGDFLSTIASITPIVDDENIINNTSNLRQVVVGSYDPNDKTCLEGETINPSMIGEYVHYQIRFENTGTYPAQNIVVKDMIDTTKFDLSTLQMVSSSHSCYTRISGNKVEFIFENINLPFDDATNDGYVVFKIITLPTLTVNSTISNTAEIYFDYNFPIVTNTATSTYQVLANQDFDFANEFVLYPNPAKSTITISAKNNTEITSVEVYNTLGHLVIAKPNFTETIDVSNLTTGTYFIKVNTEKGSGTTKFIKE